MVLEDSEELTVPEVESVVRQYLVERIGGGEVTRPLEEVSRIN